MKPTKNIARLAVTAGLTAALSFGGVMAPVTMAFAEDGSTVPANSITIKQDEKNKDATNLSKKTQFVAYQIFKAKVVDGTGSGNKVVSDVEWGANVTSDTQNAIIAAIQGSAGYDSTNPKLPTENPTAQDVAEWMAANLQSASGAVNNGDLLDTIADLVKKTTPAKPKGADSAGFTADVQVSFENSGYYLFLTDDGSIGAKNDYSNKRQTGTSPIFTVVGGSAVEVTEKTGIPTVTKKIKDDKPGSGWADKADSQAGQNVQYQLTGTVAENVASFDTYCYEFHDELSAGLTANDASIKVYAGNNRTSAVEITSGFTHEVKNAENGSGQTLTVKFDNLKTAVTGLASSTKIFVEYTAQLDPSKAVVVGKTGNENSVKLVYSNNPMSDGKGESVPDTVRDYTYALKLVKVDSVETTKKIEGVKFTIQATTPDDTSSNGKYVQEKGNLCDTAYEFTTNGEGEISVAGLDAGTYTVHEVEGSNPGYNTLADFTFTITAGGLGKLEGETLDGNNDPNTLKVTAESGDSTMVTPSADGGTVTLTVKNKKGSNLPLTGLNGVTFTWIAGGAVLCIGVAHLIRSRKRDDGSEE